MVDDWPVLLEFELCEIDSLELLNIPDEKILELCDNEERDKLRLVVDPGMELLELDKNPDNGTEVLLVL
jgi:hypothetical protein